MSILMNFSFKAIYAGCYQLFRVLLLLVAIPILIACRQSDAVSSKEVLQQLKKQDLAVATFAGIIPASFFLTHLGAIANTTDLGNTTWMVAGLGMITGVSIIAGTFWVSKKASPF